MNDPLQLNAKKSNLFDAGAEKVQGPILICMDEHHERVPLARHVLQQKRRKHFIFVETLLRSQKNFTVGI